MDDLIERLRALHVWPQIVADYHADILTPRQGKGLYEVGNVAHEASNRLAELEATLASLNDTDIIARTMVDNKALTTRLAEVEAERDGLRAALEAISSPCYVSIDDCPDHDQPNGWRVLAVARVDIARQALGAKP